VVVIALLREWAGGGSGVATAPQASGPRGRDNAACPSACDNGKRIDNSVCPHLSGDAVEAILQSIDGNSVVWEWGEGSSAVYFAQCALEWNVVISDRQHCSDIKALASPNVKVMPVHRESRRQAVHPTRRAPPRHTTHPHTHPDPFITHPHTPMQTRVRHAARECRCIAWTASTAMRGA
jgi:hypothetical protein